MNLSPEDRNLSVTSVHLPAQKPDEIGQVLSVDDEIKRGTAELRRWTATRIVWTFIGGNAVTLIALGALVWLDELNLREKLAGPEQRVVTEHVIMALLGATTVQIGVIAAIIARYLFPGHGGDE
jgi:hypothetical protein